MFVSRLSGVAAQVDVLVRELDVEVLSVQQCEALLPMMVRMHRQVGAAMTLMASRVADARRSEREAAQWLAEETGTSRQEAADTLATGNAVRNAEETRDRFQQGELASGTAQAIAQAAEADPASEGRLLDAAAKGSAEDVRKEARRTRRAASQESDEQREQRRHARRHLTAREDDDGGITGRFGSTPRQWAPIAASLEVFTEAAFRKARRTGERATQGAYRIDGFALMAHVSLGGAPSQLGYIDADLPAGLRRALVARLATRPEPTPATTDDTAAEPAAPAEPGEPVEASGPAQADPSCSTRAAATPVPRLADVGGRGVDRKVIVRVDVSALKRGTAVPGETCDIAGVGPISVAAARDALGDAFLALLVTDGRDVVTVAHAGRPPNAWQRTALEWRFDECVTRGCHNQVHLETDHGHDWADTRYTYLRTLRRGCPSCHRRKTVDGWAWVGEPDPFGKQRMVPPDHPEHPERAATPNAHPTPSSVTPRSARRPRRSQHAEPDLDGQLPLIA